MYCRLPPSELNLQLKIIYKNLNIIDWNSQRFMYSPTKIKTMYTYRNELKLENIYKYHRNNKQCLQHEKLTVHQLN